MTLEGFDLMDAVKFECGSSLGTKDERGTMHSKMFLVVKNLMPGI